jgi:hypothetical protein
MGAKKAPSAAVVPSASTLMAYAIMARATDTSASATIPVVGGRTPYRRAAAHTLK